MLLLTPLWQDGDVILIRGCAVRRADRLFDIIQALRSARQPMTAVALAERLEVSARTVYRDIATLQARRVPIEGAPGVGYVLRGNYDLPPLTFDAEEVESIAVGLRMIHRLRDAKLQRAAQRVLDKVSLSLPEPSRRDLLEPPVWVSEGSAATPKYVDSALIRYAIRETQKVRIGYVDESGARSRRVVLPLAMVYYVDATLLAAWCERRRNFRHFRIERIQTWVPTGERFTQEAGDLLTQWQAMKSLQS
jgi:predicted DNA-binding transcriptional regulator YafY